MEKVETIVCTTAAEFSEKWPALVEKLKARELRKLETRAIADPLDTEKTIFIIRAYTAVIA